MIPLMISVKIPPMAITLEWGSTSAKMAVGSLESNSPIAGAGRLLISLIIFKYVKP